MNLSEAETIALDYMGEYGLLYRGWTFKFDRARRRAGACHYRNKTITMSESYVKNNDSPAVVNTILHEIAHALTPGSGHGATWRAMAISIGCDGNRTTEAVIDNTPARYRAECPAPGHAHVVAEYHRRPGRRMLLGGYCKIHRLSVNWLDTTTGQNLLKPHEPVAVAAQAPARKPKIASRPEPAWVRGSSNWDEMFN